MADYDCNCWIFSFQAIFTINLTIKRPQNIQFTTQIEKRVTLFTMK